jgi:hypothetical protein
MITSFVATLIVVVMLLSPVVIGHRPTTGAESQFENSSRRTDR